MGDRGESREPIPGESPPKRRRVIDDDENSEVENEEGNNNYDKEEQDGGEDEGDEEEDEGSESEPPSPPNPRNGGPRRGINTPGKAPEAGIIKQVYVENFMCHRKFKVELCRNVNFITGQNGSGKSAILAAIQICLGAGARRTHRARNLKDLVRKDAASNAPNCAKIQVSILNKGSDAYEPEIYGDTIIVERTISLKGVSTGSSFTIVIWRKNPAARRISVPCWINCKYAFVTRSSSPLLIHPCFSNIWNTPSQQYSSGKPCGRSGSGRGEKVLIR